MNARRSKLNALKQDIARRTLPKEAWQTIWYMHSLEPWQWGLLQRWMRRCMFEFRTADDASSVGYFEYRFVGFRTP